MCSAGGTQVFLEWVAPFGNPRLGLLDSSPRLFAVLPRPSSALDTKASTVRLNRLTCFRIDTSPRILLLRYVTYKNGLVIVTKPPLGYQPPVVPYVSTNLISSQIPNCQIIVSQKDGVVNKKRLERMSQHPNPLNWLTQNGSLEARPLLR